MKIDFYTKYTGRAASPRQRYIQYIPALEAAGMRTQVYALLDDSYLDCINEHRRPSLFSLAKCYLRRFHSLLTEPGADLAVIQHELWPYLPGLLERLVRVRHPRWVLDFDDAYYLQYRKVPGLRGKLDRLMASCSAVTVGNAYLAEYARRFASRVGIFPTTVDLDRYTPRRKPEVQRELVIGWMGSPTTASFLHVIRDAMSRLARDPRIRLRSIGAGKNFSLDDIPIEQRPWSLETEIAELHEFDIGIMPLADNEFARGKCGFKLIQYMACAVPVVASPVGVNSAIVEHGTNGLLATTTEEWVDSLLRLASDPALRWRMGQAGRRNVEERYSLQAVLPRLISFYQSVVQGKT